MASELEGYLFKETFESAAEKGFRNLGRASRYLEDYHLFQGTREEPVLRRLRNEMGGAGVPMEGTKGEWGRGQVELNLEHADPLEMARDEDQVWKEGKLTMSFTVPLAEPLDPRKETFEVKIYDPEFFIAFDYAKDQPVSVAGAMPAPCRLEVAAVPTDAEIDQTRTMLASKGKDWKPADNVDFGSLFAQAVSIPCGS